MGWRVRRTVFLCSLTGVFAVAMAVGLRWVKSGDGGDGLGDGTADLTAPEDPDVPPAPLPELAPTPGPATGPAGAPSGAPAPAGRPATAPPPPAEAPDAPQRLRVTFDAVVRDESGVPVEGAVFAVTVERRGGGATSRWGLRPLAVTPPSDDRGAFHADLDLSVTSDVAGARGMVLAFNANAGGVQLLDPTEFDVEQLAGGIELRVRRLSRVRLQVLDARSRAVIAGASVHGCQAALVEGWWECAGTGAIQVQVRAPGYAALSVVLTFPPDGTVTRDEPILLEPGFTLRGQVRALGGMLLNGAFVAAERADQPDTTPRFRHVTADTEGRFELALPVGPWRMVVLAREHAPHVQDVPVQDRDIELPITLRPFGSEGPPPPLPWRWAERRDVEIPMATENLSADQLVAWIEVIAGAPIAIEPDARAALAALQVNASFNGVPAANALEFLAAIGKLEFDADTGTLRAPR